MSNGFDGRAAADPAARLGAVGKVRTGANAGGKRPVTRARLESLERRALMSTAALTPWEDLGPIEAVEVQSLAADAGPSVTSTSPANGAVGVPRDSFISANVYVPSGGINADTLGAHTVLLYRTSDGATVAASRNTSAGGDVLVLGPSSLLEADTDYTFEVTSGLKDLSGDAFAPLVVHFRTGTAISAADSSLKFQKVELPVPPAPYTAVTKGPDGRLYAATEGGEIIRFDIRADGTLANAQGIRSLIDYGGGAPRLLTGIEFDPASTASDLVLWATHSHYAVDNGPDWTGKVTRLSGPNLATVQDYVVGLPRSTRDHVTNQLTFGPDGAIYFPQASNTAMGAPDYAWHFRPERKLTAAILRLDVGLVRERLAAGQGPLNVQTEDGGSYEPTAAGAPLTIYAHGVRNAYDLLWHSNGELYAPANGSQRGGATPAGNGVPGIEFVDQVENDYLFRIDVGGYYGHPNPARGQFARNGGNPTDGVDPYEIPQYPVGTQPGTNWRPPAYGFGQHYSPNGVIEYRGQAFGGTLDGKILVARFSGGDDVVVLTADADGRIVDARSGIEGLKNFNDPLDLTEDLATGYLYVVEFGGQRITLVKPSVAGAAPGDPTPQQHVPPAPYGLVAKPVGRGTLELNWTDTIGESGYRIERSDDGVNGWTQVGATAANTTQFADAGLERGRTYVYRVRADSAAGSSDASLATVATMPVLVVPPGWTGGDVGSVGVHGVSDFFNNTFELSGSGGDIGAGGDAFLFASSPVRGDVEIVARVTNLNASHPLAKAGVMIRGTRGADAPNAMMALTGTRGPEFQARLTTAADTTSVNQGIDGASWYWLRLVRRGDTVSGYTSVDAANWSRVSFAHVALGEDVLAGLAVTSHDDSSLATVTFDNVRINPAPPLPLAEAPGDLYALANGFTSVNLTWRDNSMEETGFQIERRRAGAGDAAWVRVARVGAEVRGYVDDHLAPSRRYEYRVRAVNASGASAPSNEAQARTGKSAVRGQVPFGWSPSNLPGVVEAEAFDEGPKGKAWKDRTPENDLGSFRDTGVDIEETTDPSGGGYHVAAAKGEWLEYTVNVPVAGTYALDVRYAADAGFGGSIRIDADGRKGDSIALPATGGWTVWQTASGAITLKAGIQVLRLSVDSGNHADADVTIANVNSMRFTLTEAWNVTQNAPGRKASQNPRTARIYLSMLDSLS
jgi:hypothetical protein